MELQPVSRQMSLLPAEHDNDDLAAAPPLAPPESANFYVDRPSILETAGVVALIATAAAVGVWFIAFVHSPVSVFHIRNSVSSRLHSLNDAKKPV